MDTLWLGYNGLALPFTEISAILIYQPALNQRLQRDYGSVPQGVQAVIITSSGDYLPARWNADQLRQRWASWRREG